LGQESGFFVMDWSSSALVVVVRAGFGHADFILVQESWFFRDGLVRAKVPSKRVRFV
jgi:hypothetical protein